MTNEIFEGMLVQSLFVTDGKAVVIDIDHKKEKCLIVWLTDFYSELASFDAIYIWRINFLCKEKDNEKLSKS